MAKPSHVSASASDGSKSASATSVAALSLRVRLISAEQDAELRELVKEYDQLTIAWQQLCQRALTALAERPILR